MASEKTYRLTGGVFFLLISQCLKNTGKTEVDCLSELAAIFEKTEKIVERKTKRTNTTQYKKCVLNNSMFLPFENRTLQQAFTSKMEQNYNSVLAEMSAFTKKYVPRSDYSWLASAIDDILQHDNSAVNEQFQILSDGGTVGYQELLDMKEVEIEPFLTGIWGFILSRRPHNTDGAGTIYELTREAETKGNQRPFVSDIGKALQKKAVSMRRTSKHDFLKNVTISEENINVKWISTDQLYLINQPDAIKKNTEYEDYFNRLKKDYNKITTLLYADNPQPFYDFYVCNNIYRFEGGRSKHRIHIKNVTVNELLEHSNYVLLSGNGGLGKSMMMRHLLLDCINRYEEVSLLPIYLELRSLVETEETLADCAYNVFTNYGGNKSREEFNGLLKSGVILLLCDGLDEIQSGKRMHFQREMEKFAVTFPESVVVISSRPFGPFGSYASMRRFTVFYLEPFSKPEALALVEKLKFHEEEPRIKHRFLDALNKWLYDSHRSFAENPLLLTIMMMMFAEIGDVPHKMHLFYNEAFQVLARKHDASKAGFTRPLATRLDVEAFKEVFTEFCARTYKDELIELTEGQMEMYYTKVKASYKGNIQWNYESFTEDLTTNLCLMFFESLKYHFIHRSFQEYFCARYISKRLDKNLYALTNSIFENKHNRYYIDLTFRMLYDMIPERIEENVFIPFLSKIFEECDRKNGYRTFLQKVYPDISYNYGETAADYWTESPFFLYRFILGIANVSFVIGDSDFPYESDFVEATYVELDGDWLEMNDSSGDNIVRKEDVPISYSSEMDDPEEVGYNLSFETALILGEPDKYPEFTARLLSEDFALKKEYNAIREYFAKLNTRHSQPHEDVFNLL